MYIKRIVLENYRNYEKLDIELKENVNIFYGKNAQGKTNLLEAIFVCAYGKSFRTKKDSDLVKFGGNKAKIEIFYNRIDREGKIRAEIEEKKTFFINDVRQSKISDIIGKINVVIFTPNDIEIIKDGPEKRRKFIDMTISSLKPKYIHLLNNYNNCLEQRNNYLKQIKNENKEEDMLDVWDEQLSKFSFQIYEYRKTYIEKYKERIEDIHKNITKCGEDIKIKYISN